MLVQQQMRNTHFGDGGGFGFNQKFKGLANTAALIAAATSGPVDEELRESHTKLPTSNPPA